MPCFLRIAVLVVVVAALPVNPAGSATVGLWNFDTIDDATYATATSGGDPVGGETLFDSSGNGLNFVTSSSFGSLLLDPRAPAPMAANTYSLESIQGGAQFARTPSSDLFHRGKTGELTIEFWFNYLRPSPTLGYIAAFDGGDPVSNDGNWDLYADSNGDIRFGMFSTNSGNPFVEVKTDYTTGFDAADGNWHHLAFTVDSAGTLTSYFDGALVQQSATGAAGVASTAAADRINLGFWRDNSTFGDHDFLIDELRISDVALLPGSGSGMNELAWNTQLATPPPVLPPRPADFGQQWLRDRPFTLSSWDATAYYADYAAAGFNTTMGGGPEAVGEGFEDHYLGAFSQLDNQSITDVQIALNQGVSAFMLKDEIPPSDIAGIGDVADYIRSSSPDAFLMAGLGSSNPSYIGQVVAGIQPDAILHAYYPFQGLTSATDDWTPALNNTALVREGAITHGVAYLSYVQSFEDFDTGANSVDDNRRLPTESEFRAEAFMKLSAGAKGLLYFRFQNNPETEDEALIDPAGNKSSLYSAVATANVEIQNLGKSLVHLTSTDWAFVAGGVTPAPTEIPAWNSTLGNGLIDSITIEGAAADRKDALVGYFVDDGGDDYFMLVNTFHGDSLDAAAATVDFTLMFDESVDAIWRLNRLTGLAEEIALTSHSLALTLPGGTGDLFKFGDGLFAGLTGDDADFNADGIVDGADFLIWQRNAGTGSSLSEGDANGDSQVDAVDLAVWQGQYGLASASGQATAVPEPGGASALCLGALCYLALARSKRRS